MPFCHLQFVYRVFLMLTTPVIKANCSFSESKSPGCWEGASLNFYLILAPSGVLVWEAWLFTWILKPSVGVCFLRTSHWCTVREPLIAGRTKQHPNRPMRLEAQAGETMSPHTCHRSTAEGGRTGVLTCSAMHGQSCALMQIHVPRPSVNLDSC